MTEAERQTEMEVEMIIQSLISADGSMNREFSTMENFNNFYQA